MSLNNAARQNYLQIREQQQLNRERAREMEAGERRRQEMLRRQKASYDHVSSHGYGCISDRPVKGDVEVKVFIRECDGERAQYYSFMESDAAMKHDDPIPAARCPPLEKRAPARAKAEPSAIPVVKPPARGVVPNYLLQRKAELAAEKEAMQREVDRQREAAKCPPGHRLVTDEERQETLVKLAARRKEMELEMHKLPIRYDTQAIKTKRKKIEDELNEIDEAERKFNAKKPLYVPV